MSNVDVSVRSMSPSGPAVVRVAGELDLAVVPEISAALESAEAAQPPVLVMDLSDVTHLDSTGLRVLLDGSRRAEADGRRFVIVAPPEGPVGRILRLTLLLEHLDTAPDLEAAEA